MKKHISFLIATALAIFSLLLSACSSTSEDLYTTSSKDLTVYTSIHPIYDFASKIGGDKIKLVNMVPGGVEPHDYEPTAYDITGLEKADVFIYNGVGMEHWVEDVLSTLSNQKLIVVEASNNIELLEGHHHEDEDHEEVDHEDEAQESEDHGDLDPHVWLSPRNAIIEMENITKAFVEADPDNKNYYENNLSTWKTKFEELDQRFINELASFTQRSIIVSHEAFGYLCHEYNLEQIGIDGLNPDSEPNPGRMAEIIDLVTEKNIQVIFFEELASSKVAQTIADGTGARTDVLNPYEGLTEEQAAAGEDYLSIMEANLEAIKNALR
ncbi:MAG: zinc ABC transporter substrate-binding protein [Vallitaleaceae bacterium]|nr:zinc ABC transporter substrate-binding protein [Vallitaleaceae bacterium]